MSAVEEIIPPFPLKPPGKKERKKERRKGRNKKEDRYAPLTGRVTERLSSLAAQLSPAPASGIAESVIRHMCRKGGIVNSSRTQFVGHQDPV